MRKTVFCLILLFCVIFRNTGLANPFDFTGISFKQITSTECKKGNNLYAYLPSRAKYLKSPNLVDSSNTLLQRVIQLAEETGTTANKMALLDLPTRNYPNTRLTIKASVSYVVFVASKEFIQNNTMEGKIVRFTGNVTYPGNKLIDGSLYNQLYIETKNELDNSRAWLFFTFVIALMLMVVGVMYHLFRWKIMSERISAAEEKFNQQNKALKKIIEEDEREKVSIANELYNGLGKILSQAKMQISLMGDLMGKGKWQIVDDTIDLVELAESKTQCLSRYLVPGDLVQNGLIPAVNELIRSVKGKKKLDVLFMFDDYAIQPPLETEVSLYRIINEIVGYAVKHQDVTHITISLKSSGARISVIVTDNGKGLNLSKLDKEDETSWFNINTRVHILKGALSIDSNKDEGTRIKVELIS